MLARWPLACCHCGTSVDKAKDLQLVNGGTDANKFGRILGSCISCSGEDARTFKRGVKRSWSTHAKEAHDKPKRLRDINWETLSHIVKNEHPDTPGGKRRRITALRLQLAASKIAESLSQGSPECRKAAAVIMRDYINAVYGKAANVEGFQASPNGWTLSAKDAGYLTELSKGLTISFLCRSPACLFFGKNDQWIKKVDSEHFRCPCCGMLYHPFSQAKGQYPAQKVLSILNPRTGVKVTFPCKWPDTEEDGWLNKTLEMNAMSINTSEDLRDFMAKKAISLSDLLDRVATPINFDRMEWNSGIEHMLCETKFPKSQWADLKANGFWGEKLLVDPDAPVFENWTELIGLLASIMAGGKAIGSKL